MLGGLQLFINYNDFLISTLKQVSLLLDYNKYGNTSFYLILLEPKPIGWIGHFTLKYNRAFNDVFIRLGISLYAQDFGGECMTLFVYEFRCVSDSFNRKIQISWKLL